MGHRFGRCWLDCVGSRRSGVYRLIILCCLVIVLGVKRFVIVFVIAYLIKARNPEMLGAILLISFFVYMVVGNKKLASRFFAAA